MPIAQYIVYSSAGCKSVINILRKIRLSLINTYVYLPCLVLEGDQQLGEVIVELCALLQVTLQLHVGIMSLKIIMST